MEHRRHIDECQYEWHDVTMSSTAIAAQLGCCTPMTASVLDAAAADQLARMFGALGDPTRVRLLSLIAAYEGGEACICDLTEPVGLSQPTVSHHMKRLTEAGLVTREQRGKWAFYRINNDVLALLSESLRVGSDPQDQRGAIRNAPSIRMTSPLR